ncbi:Zn-finger in ubiquitin-hydrolase (macronuclear) [Tetrahymena thermophila SB210]|uniref:Zn-finger in ubiquitin-hydrolase n=1 Tax=Tetrahymena thermophila (strain SB210) TaxID=312017 RepID=I7LXK9_TETTS|nr:Zn-finger in ubiquitin-hydrolase [Tetrahymena thermophila SB210]EAS04844.2 Zn-finger in ubiquitin-hydrolase [Tetrahymena thermophila SB210]|eukprot:XP_001025089.2 Zn-finger in ubiquitin-hydrolase [Tetrahymena thermophila SB210]
MIRDLNFEEDARKEQEIKRLLIEDEIDYWIGNPVVQIIHGQLILDKDTQNSLVFNASIEDLIVQRRQIIQNDKERNYNALVVLGIQNSKSPLEICEFFKEQQHSTNITEIRVIKTTSNIIYGMILFFSSCEICNEFLNKNFGQRFNTIEEDVCILRPIKAITFSLDTYDIKNEEESLLFSRHNSKSSCSTASINTNSSSQQNSNVNQPQAQNAQSIIPQQLPTNTLSLTYNFMQTDNNQVINCAICQEQLLTHLKDQDSPKKQMIGGNSLQEEDANCSNLLELSPNKQNSQKKNIQDQILSIMCGHYFHSACLSKWQDSICPLCRYHQQPPELSYCDVCRSSEALWMCLVCGSINCGMEFMTQSHVKMHYEETQHTYSMEIESKFVYDHSRDTFVHRLMQNLADGKIVEIDSANIMNDQQNNYEYEKGKKSLDSLKEYEIQMSTCLEAQRKEYQAKLQEFKRQNTKKLQGYEQKKAQLIFSIEQEKELLASEENQLKLEEENLNKSKQMFLVLSQRKIDLQKEENTLSQKHQQLGLKDEQQEDNMKKKLLAIQQDIQAKIQEIKDIENHLKANKKLKEIGEDTSSSALLVLGSSKNNSKKKKKK